MNPAPPLTRTFTLPPRGLRYHCTPNPTNRRRLTAAEPRVRTLSRASDPVAAARKDWPASRKRGLPASSSFRWLGRTDLRRDCVIHPLGSTPSSLLFSMFADRGPSPAGPRDRGRRRPRVNPGAITRKRAIGGFMHKSKVAGAAYLGSDDFRMYVVDNKDWNAMAAPNPSITGLSGEAPCEGRPRPLQPIDGRRPFRA